MAQRKPARTASRKSPQPRRPKAPGPDTGRPTSAARLTHEEGRREVIVRMYRQGLGDCFLLALPTANPTEPRYLLIDCGVHSRETEGTARLAQVMENLVTATGSHLDIVVATHEHADHLSGFVQKGSPFLKDELTIGQLWVAWTEKRGDRQADALRKLHGTAQKVIERAVEESRRRAGVDGERFAEHLLEITDFERPGLGAVDVEAVQAKVRSLVGQAVESDADSVGPDSEFRLGVGATAKLRPSSNELALGLLAAKAGAGKTRFFEPGEVTTIPGISDLRAYVLGPPRTPELLEQDKPSKIRGAKEGDAGGEYKEVYLSGGSQSRALALSPELGIKATESGGQLSDDFRYPFPRSYRRSFEIVSAKNGNPRFQWNNVRAVPDQTEEFIDRSYLDPRKSWRRIDSDWLSGAEPLALNLVGDTNNTSLVLAFEWGPPGEGVVLLFPGDAQVGNWLSWRDQNYKAGGKQFTADELLSRTILYKVGHHGSHNATARRDSRETTDASPLGVPFGLELMKDIIAMIPVDWEAAKKEMPDPWKMPHEPLYRRLREKADRRVLRSDQLITPLNEDSEPADRFPSSPDWKPVPGLKNARWRCSTEKFRAGTREPLYYDVAISLERE